MAVAVVGPRKPRVVSVVHIAALARSVLIECPVCSVHGSIDEDQYAGRVSIDCPECDYHETHDLRP